MNYYNDGTGTVPTGDLRVHSNGPTPVPQPASLTLFGTGLALSATIARRRGRKAKE